MNDYLASAMLMILVWIILKYADMMYFIPYGVRRESVRMLSDPELVSRRYRVLHENLIELLKADAFPELIGEVVGHMGAIVSDHFKVLVATITNPDRSPLAKASKDGIAALKGEMQISPALQKALGKVSQYTNDLKVLQGIFQQKGGKEYG